jgi:hypothetical protein
MPRNRNESSPHTRSFAAPNMSGRRPLLDTTRTVFIRTSGTRLSTGFVSVHDLNDAFQEAFGDSVTVTHFRKIGNGLIIELNSEANKNKTLDGQLVILGLKCRVNTHIVQNKPPKQKKASQPQIAASTATTAAESGSQLQKHENRVQKEDGQMQIPPTTANPTQRPADQQQQEQQHLQTIKDALGQLDSHSVTPTVTAIALFQVKSVEPGLLALQLIANTTTSLMSELVRLLCVGDKGFRDCFAKALVSEFETVQRLAREEELALEAKNAAAAVVTIAPTHSTTPRSQRMAILATLIGKLAGSRTLAHAEVMTVVRMCAPDVAIAAHCCDMFALCTITENMTGAPSPLVGECVARLQRSERFCPPLPFVLSAEVRRVSTMQSVSRVSPTMAPTTAASAAAAPGAAATADQLRLRPWRPPLAQPHLAAPAAATTASTSDRDRSLLVDVFGVKLAKEHGARLHRHALDGDGLIALIDFANLDRVEIFTRLDIPLGHAVQMSAALERYKARCSGGNGAQL